MTFQSAEESCVNRGGHLVSVVSQEEMAYIESYIANYHKCGDYWTEDPDTGLCYYVSGELVDWNSANASCLESDSTLVMIKSAEKNNRLKSLSMIRS
jgi:hypothetical protein